MLDTPPQKNRSMSKQRQPGCANKPIVWIYIQPPGIRDIIQCTPVRFDPLLTAPLPGHLDIGTAWCYKDDLRKLEDGRYMMTNEKLVA